MASSSKPEYPPQGGEARLCFTVFVAMVLSIMSAVTIIYSTVIVYFPALKVLESNMQGQKICTSLKVERRLQGAKNCQGIIGNMSALTEINIGEAPSYFNTKSSLVASSNLDTSFQDVE